VLAHELPGPEQAEPIARKLLQAVSEPVALHGRDYRVSACVGIATYPHDAQDERTLVRQASLALRAAKRLGTGSVKFVDVGAASKEPGAA